MGRFISGLWRGLQRRKGINKQTPNLLWRWSKSAEPERGNSPTMDASCKFCNVIYFLQNGLLRQIINKYTFRRGRYSEYHKSYHADIGLYSVFLLRSRTVPDQRSVEDARIHAIKYINGVHSWERLNVAIIQWQSTNDFLCVHLNLSIVHFFIQYEAVGLIHTAIKDSACAVANKQTTCQYMMSVFVR